MKRQDLESYLNDYLKIDTIKDYCPNGLQVEGKEEIFQIATAVSASLATIQLAVEMGVDALITHHGLFWEKDPYPIKGTKKKKVELLLQSQLSLFAYHLPLDAHPEVGNNWHAARALQWQNLEAFGEYYGTFIGVKGRFPPEPVEKFIQKVENYYGHPATTALGGGKMIKSAALISGGAYKEIAAAASTGVDCFITGNFDEPAWNMAHEEKIHFLALGHTATEKIGPKALAEHLSECFGVRAFFVDTPNPF